MSDERLTTAEHTEAHGDRIKGYRKLGEEEIASINRVKALGETIRAELDTLAEAAETDQRCLAIARTHLQTGVMFAVRAIAKPEGF